MAGGGEPAHIHADLGDDGGRRDQADPGGLIQLLHRCREGSDQLPDRGIEIGDVRVDPVDPGQHLAQQT